MAKTYGGSGGELAFCVAQTNDFGYILAGAAYSSDGDVVNSHTGGEYWIIKLKDSTTRVFTDTLTGCNKISFKGITHTSNTILYDTIKKFNGLDSIYNIHYIIVYSITPTIVKSTITGCNSVTFNGNTYTSNSVSRDTVKTLFRCDSIYSEYNIIVYTSTPPKTNIDTVSGCSNVNYNGNTYTTSTILKDTVRTFFGCDSIYNIHQIIVQQYNSKTVADTILGCNSLTYRGKVYSNNVCYYGYL